MAGYYIKHNYTIMRKYNMNKMTVCEIKYTLSRDIYAALFLKLFLVINTSGFKRYLFNAMKKFHDFSFETPFLYM